MAIVFGDSLSAWRTGWVGQLMAQGHWYKLHAQSMRFAGTGSLVPDDILPIDGHRTAFYWLGTNDAGLWYSEEYQQTFKTAFNADLSKLHNAAYGPLRFNIVLIKPCQITLPDRDTAGVRAYIQQWKELVVDYFGSTQVRMIDPDDHNVMDDSPDGLHLSEATAGTFGTYLHNFGEAWEAEG